MRWAGYIGRMGKRDLHKDFWSVNMWETVNMENIDVNGMSLLKLIFKKWCGAWASLVSLRKGQVVAFFKYSNEILGCVECGEIFD